MGAARKDLTGLYINDWHVLRYLGNRMYECQCKCGNIKAVQNYSLTSGKSKSCGKCDQGKLPKMGDKFGDWEVIGEIDKSTYKVMCRCSCGVERAVNIYTLINKTSTNCGHLKNLDRVIDLKGRHFGKLEVIKYLGDQRWECKCSCGNTCIKHRNNLLDGRATQCPICSGKTPVNLLGLEFGKLKPVEYLGDKKWLCLCACGNSKVIRSCNLTNHSTISCGCIQYKSDKDHLIEVATKFKNIHNRFPTLTELAELENVTYGCMVYHIGKLDLHEYIEKNSSIIEKEIFEYASSIYNGEIVRNTKAIIPPLELDIYIPDKKIAIEVNGTYWHSYLFKDKKYHQDKTIQCRKQGIHLIHIFEYEWNNPDIQDRIKHLISRSINCENRVEYARNLSISEIDANEARAFLELYHLQGFIPARVYVGLYTKDKELVGVMSFGAPRFNHEFEYEILRLAYKDTYAIVGGTQRMWKYFLNRYKPNSVISYCDLAKFSGNIYTELGMQLDKINDPSFIWVSPITGSIVSRFQIMNGEIKEYDLIEKGYYKIYDSGTLRFVWKS